MGFPAAKLQNLSFKVAALALCLWLSGATCAISCCAATFSPNDAARVEANETPSCHAKHNADSANGAANSDSSTFVASSHRAPTLDCCAFLRVTAERAQQIAQFDATIIAPAAPFRFVAPAAIARRAVASQNHYKPIPQNRGSTHLRNCVFLI